MREIKFRAWDKKNKRFFKPTHNAYRGQLEDLLIMPLSGQLVLRTHGALTHQSAFDDPNRFILQQFTELKDKNGKEIYEDDIVKQTIILDGDYLSPHGKSDATAQVIWYGDGWKIAPLKTQRKHPTMLQIVERWIEIIGNIYSNPELIKEK